MLQQTSGEVLFDGHTWKREDLKSIGSLIEAPPLYSNLTAAENLKVRCVMLGLPDSRIAEVLEITGLTGTGKKRRWLDKITVMPCPGRERINSRKS